MTVHLERFSHRGDALFGSGKRLHGIPSARDGEGNAGRVCILACHQLVRCLKFEGVQFVALFGALTAGQVTSLKVQQGNLADGSDMADLAGNAHAALADTDANKCLVTDVFRPQKRYVRAVVTRGTANAAIDGVIALQYGSRVKPTTNDSTVKATKLLISPDEGVA